MGDHRPRRRLVHGVVPETDLAGQGGSARRRAPRSVRHYNAEPDSPLLILEIGIFGSYLDPAVDAVGDVDVTAALGPRPWINRDGERYRYAQRAKRQLSSYTDLVLWPEEEARLLLKSRSPYLNIHQEDISRFTDQHRVLYRVPKSVLRDAWHTPQPAAT